MSAITTTDPTEHPALDSRDFERTRLSRLTALLGHRDIDTGVRRPGSDR